MTGGIISGNTSDNNGGGVYINGNVTDRMGGGVYIGNNGTFNLNSPAIYGAAGSVRSNEGDATGDPNIFVDNGLPGGNFKVNGSTAIGY